MFCTELLWKAKPSARIAQSAAPRASVTGDSGQQSDLSLLPLFYEAPLQSKVLTLWEFFPLKAQEVPGMETLRQGRDQAEQRGAGGLVGACPCVLILLCPRSAKCSAGAACTVGSSSSIPGS